MTEKNFKKFSNNKSSFSSKEEVKSEPKVESKVEVKPEPKIEPKVEKPSFVEEPKKEKVEITKPIKNVPTFNKSSGKYVNVKLLRRKKGR